MNQIRLIFSLLLGIVSIQIISVFVASQWFGGEELTKDSVLHKVEVAKWFDSLSSKPFMRLNNTRGFKCPPNLVWEKRLERINLLDGSSLNSYLMQSLPASIVGSTETISVPVYPPLDLINASNPAADVPVVFVHMHGIKKNAERYVMLAMRTACRFNKRVFVASVGYNSSEMSMQYPPCVTPVYYSVKSANEETGEAPRTSVEDALRRFTDVYKHMSGNQFLFEKFCFDRWIIFHDLLQKLNLEKVLYLDSDVLLFANASVEAASFDPKCGAHISSNKKGGFSGHSSYWTRSKAADFVNFIQQNYENDSLRAKMENMWENYQNNYLKKGQIVRGGISDMHLIKLFFEKSKASQDVCVLGDIYDHCRVFDYRKNSFYQDELGLPYTIVKDNSTNTNVLARLRTLHFQGGAKEVLNECTF
jgi:hypothetical protein